MKVEIGIYRIDSISNTIKYEIFDTDNENEIDIIANQLINYEILNKDGRFYEVPRENMRYFINDIG